MSVVTNAGWVDPPAATLIVPLDAEVALVLVTVEPSPINDVLEKLSPVSELNLILTTLLLPPVAITKTNLKSVKVAGMLEKVIDAAALPKVVVAIGSYVAGIYAPLIPYSEITEVVSNAFVAVRSMRLIAEVDNHNPDDNLIVPDPFAS